MNSERLIEKIKQLEQKLNEVKGQPELTEEDRRELVTLRLAFTRATHAVQDHVQMELEKKNNRSNELKKQLKILALKENTSLPDIARKLDISVPALNNRLARDSVKYFDIEDILKELGFKIVWVKINEEEEK